MPLMRSTFHSSILICLTFAGGAFAQTANYTSVDAIAGSQVQVGYHGTVNKNCTAAPIPTIRVLEPPSFGTLSVKTGTITTDRVSGCERLQVPALILFYTAKQGYAGNDKVVYGVADAKGQVNTYDVTIRVKPAPAPSTSSQNQL